MPGTIFRKPSPSFAPVFLLDHVFVQTTERYLGCKQRIRGAVNDHIGIDRSRGQSHRSGSPTLRSCVVPAWRRTGN